jgi:hypothetical protein
VRLQRQPSWEQQHAWHLGSLLRACEEMMPIMEPQHLANTLWAAAALQLTVGVVCVHVGMFVCVYVW